MGSLFQGTDPTKAHNLSGQVAGAPTILAKPPSHPTIDRIRELKDELRLDIDAVWPHLVVWVDNRRFLDRSERNEAEDSSRSPSPKIQTWASRTEQILLIYLARGLAVYDLLKNDAANIDACLNPLKNLPRKVEAGEPPVPEANLFRTVLWLTESFASAAFILPLYAKVKPGVTFAANNLSSGRAHDLQYWQEVAKIVQSVILETSSVDYMALLKDLASSLKYYGDKGGRHGQAILYLSSAFEIHELSRLWEHRERRRDYRKLAALIESGFDLDIAEVYHRSIGSGVNARRVISLMSHIAANYHKDTTGTGQSVIRFNRPEQEVPRRFDLHTAHDSKSL